MDRSNQPLVAAFAYVLRDARGRAALSQEELADRADMSARFISMLETGKRQPSLSALAAVSVGLGVPLSALMVAIEERLSARDGSDQSPSPVDPAG